MRFVPVASARRGHLLGEALAGLVRVARQPTLRGLAVCYALYQVTWGMLIVAVPVVAGRHFGGGTSDMVAGVLWAASGVTGAAGR